MGTSASVQHLRLFGLLQRLRYWPTFSDASTMAVLSSPNSSSPFAASFMIGQQQGISYSARSVLPIQLDSNGALSDFGSSVYQLHLSLGTQPGADGRYDGHLETLIDQAAVSTAVKCRVEK